MKRKFVIKQWIVGYINTYILDLPKTCLYRGAYNVCLKFYGMYLNI